MTSSNANSSFASQLSLPFAGVPQKWLYFFTNSFLYPCVNCLSWFVPQYLIPSSLYLLLGHYIRVVKQRTITPGVQILIYNEKICCRRWPEYGGTIAGEPDTVTHRLRAHGGISWKVLRFHGQFPGFTADSRYRASRSSSHVYCRQRRCNFHKLLNVS